MFWNICGKKFTKYLHGTWSFLNILMIFGIKKYIYKFDPYNLFLAIATNIPRATWLVLWSRVTYIYTYVPTPKHFGPLHINSTSAPFYFLSGLWLTGIPLIWYMRSFGPVFSVLMGESDQKLKPSHLSQPSEIQSEFCPSGQDVANGWKNVVY